MGNISGCFDIFNVYKSELTFPLYLSQYFRLISVKLNKCLSYTGPIFSQPLVQSLKDISIFSWIHCYSKIEYCFPSSNTFFAYIYYVTIYFKLLFFPSVLLISKLGCITAYFNVILLSLTELRHL